MKVLFCHLKIKNCFSDQTIFFRHQFLNRFEPKKSFFCFVKQSQMKVSTSHSSTSSNWISLGLDSKTELNLSNTLRCGQAFRWRHIEAEDVWMGVLRWTLFELKASEGQIVFRSYESKNGELEMCGTDQAQRHKEWLKDYFRADVSLKELMDTWSKADSKFDSVRFAGLRLLRQDPVECLFSFICSQNNNIPRITKMIESLCSSAGSYLGLKNGIKWYSFPTLKEMCKVTENQLKTLGFGYRAKYIVQTCKQLSEKEEHWLNSLRQSSHQTKRSGLLSLMGVGKKVADCVSLFSLDQYDIVPVDTHVWTIAQRYLPSLRGKTLSDKTYQQVQEFFRSTFGKECGWAHTIMFAGELRFFQETPKKGRKRKHEESSDDEESEESDQSSE